VIHEQRHELPGGRRHTEAAELGHRVPRWLQPPGGTSVTQVLALLPQMVDAVGWLAWTTWDVASG
jgi:hypothetical protein